MRGELLNRLILLGAEYSPKELAPLITQEYLGEMKNLEMVKTPSRSPEEVCLVGGEEKNTEESRIQSFKAYHLWHDYFYEKPS